MVRRHSSSLFQNDGIGSVGSQAAGFRCVKSGSADVLLRAASILRQSVRRCPFLLTQVIGLLVAFGPGMCLGPRLALGQVPADDSVRLERVPPRTPAEAWKSFEVAEGFAIELVASEPLVCDPIASLFDAKGRLVVIEMMDYSEQDQAQLGRVRRLTDDNADGVMDSAETLVEGLSWPTALALVGEDVLVVHPPLMSLIHETSPGVFTLETKWRGLSRANVQGMANSFRWGLDNRWHLSTSSNGGSLEGAGIEKRLELQGRDLQFDPVNGAMGSEIGGGQHGMDWNAWGDKFVTSNSDHLQQIVAWDVPSVFWQDRFEAHAWRRSIAVDGPQADVYRASPVEAWREWRTQLRLTGKHAGLIEGGGRAAGYFTGATGVFVLDGDQIGLNDPPHVVVADVGGNLVHRKRLFDDGLQWRGERVDNQTEFVRSSDVWFRPVQFGDGPDGCLYILDMYREVIEHPASLPPPIKRQLDLTSGQDRGRIWRVKRTGVDVRRDRVDLSVMTSAELVPLLTHPNGWHRETASRLLYERQDASLIPLLVQLAKSAPIPEGRVQAIATLMGLLGGAAQVDWVAALEDSRAEVRRWSIQCLGRAQPLPVTEAMRKALWKMASEDSLAIRFALAVNAVPCLAREERADFLWQVIGDEGWKSTDLRMAVTAASGPDAKALLSRLALREVRVEDEASWIQSWFHSVVTQDGLANALPILTSHANSLADAGDQDRAIRWLSTAKEVLRRRWPQTTQADQAKVHEWFEHDVLPNLEMLLTYRKDARNDVASGGAESATMLAELRAWLGVVSVAPPVTRLQILEKIVPDEKDHAIVQAALENAVLADEATNGYVYEHYSQLPIESQAYQLRQWSRRLETANLVLLGLESQRWKSGQIPVDVWQQLASFTTPEFQKRLSPFRPTVSTKTWEEMSAGFREAWNSEGNIERGEKVFAKHCAACHRHQGLGVELGPGLASLRSKSNDQIGLSVAEPSREIDPKYQVYQWELTDGEVVVGLMEESRDAEVVVRDGRGEQRILARESIERSQASSKSLMPEGLLEQIDPQAFNDLIAFLRK